MRNPELRRLGTVLAEDYCFTVRWTKDNGFIAHGEPGEILLVGKRISEQDWFAHATISRDRIVDSADSGAEAVAAVEEWLDESGGLP